LKNEHIELEGVITKSFKGKDFSVKVEGIPHEIMGTLKGKLIQNKISVVIGDTVKILVSTFDLKRGFIATRLGKRSSDSNKR
jgi:translation initiation factor IF-1